MTNITLLITLLLCLGVTLLGAAQSSKLGWVVVVFAVLAMLLALGVRL